MLCMHVLDQQLVIHRHNGIHVDQQLLYIDDVMVYMYSTVSYHRQMLVYVIHRQMLWYTCTGSTVSYT